MPRQKYLGQMTIITLYVRVYCTLGCWNGILWLMKYESVNIKKKLLTFFELIIMVSYTWTIYGLIIYEGSILNLLMPEHTDITIMFFGYILLFVFE